MFQRKQKTNLDLPEDSTLGRTETEGQGTVLGWQSQRPKGSKSEHYLGMI